MSESIRRQKLNSINITLWSLNDLSDGKCSPSTRFFLAARFHYVDFNVFDVRFLRTKSGFILKPWLELPNPFKAKALDEISVDSVFSRMRSVLQQLIVQLPFFDSISYDKTNTGRLRSQSKWNMIDLSMPNSMGSDRINFIRNYYLTNRIVGTIVTVH